MLFEHFGLLMCNFNEKECQKSKQNIRSKNCSEKESQRDPESRVGGRGGTPLEKTLYLPSGLYVVHVLPGGPALKALALRLRTEARGRIYVASGEFRPRELKDFVKQ